MIKGKVDARRQAWVQVEIRDEGGRVQSVDAVVDTGFTGYLILPYEMIGGMTLRQGPQTHVTLAAGVRGRLNTWRGYVLWHDQPRLIQILEARGTPLLGMRMLEDSQLTIQARANGDVLIEKLDTTAL